MKIFNLTLCSLALFITCLPSIGAEPVLQIGYIERAPHIYANADGSIRGLIGKRMMKLLRRARVDADLVQVQPKDIDDFISNPNLGGFIATRTLIEQPQNFVFTQRPLFAIQFYAYHLKQTPELSGLVSLKNARVVLPIAMDSFKGPLKEHIRQTDNQIDVVAEISNLEQQIVLLRQSKADYAISYFGPDTVAMMFSDRARRDDVMSSQLFSLPMYLIVRKSFAGAQRSIEKIDRVMSMQ